MGTFVTEDKEVIKKFKKGMATNIVNNFLIEMKKLGFTPSEIMDIISEWIEKEERE